MALNYLFNIAIFACIYGILAVSFNFQLGFTRLFNLSHIALFGIGAYTSALLSASGVSFWVALPLAGIVAGFFGIIIGIPALQLKGDYFAIATLGFAEIARLIMKNEIWLTGGPFGMTGIPRPSAFWTGTGYEGILVLAISVLSISYLIVERLIHSPFGRVLRGIREDEIAARSLGKNVFSFKLQTVAVGSFLAGLAGSLYAHFVQFISPLDFTVAPLVIVLTMVVLGGAGNNLGAIVGAVMLVSLPEALRFTGLPSEIYAPVRQVLIGLVLVGLMIMRPQGLIGEKKTLYESTENEKNA